MDNDMIGYKVEAEAPQVALPLTGWTVTNHLNLFYMLGASLVLPPSGFDGKYYQDTLASSPGWVPVFLDKKVAAGALALSTSEAAHLRPAILEVDLTGLSGVVTMSCLWLPAPLPTTRVKRILFASQADKAAAESDAADYGNVPIGDFKRNTMKTAFVGSTKVPWPPNDMPAPREAPVQAPLAIGAVAAMFLHLGNRGTLSVRACHAVFDPDGAPAVQDDPLRTLSTWAQTGSVPVPVDAAGASPSPYEGLFWGLVDRLVLWRSEPRSLSAEDALLSHLEGQIESLEQRAKAGAKGLLETLERLTGLGAGPTSELFSRHQTPLARSMILFFLRDRCGDLLDFKSKELHEIDWLTAAILFGVRDSWLGIPQVLRDIPGLAAAVSDRMARLSHGIAGTDPGLGAPSPRVKPLRELLETEGEWSSAQDAVAQELVRTHNWNCATTRISLRPGTYKMTVDRGGAHIDVVGEPNVVKVVDKASFFDLLAKNTIRGSAEAKVRKRLLA